MSPAGSGSRSFERTRTMYTRGRPNPSPTKLSRISTWSCRSLKPPLTSVPEEHSNPPKIPMKAPPSERPECPPAGAARRPRCRKASNQRGRLPRAQRYESSYPPRQWDRHALTAPSFCSTHHHGRKNRRGNFAQPLRWGAGPVAHARRRGAWPLATAPVRRSLNSNGDVMLNEWMVAARHNPPPAGPARRTAPG
jgi:hypothetical protein